MVRIASPFCCIGLCLAFLLAACETPPHRRPGDAAGAAPSEDDRTTDTAQIVALVNGSPLTVQALRRPLMERAGEEILREAVLDHLLAERCRALGLTIEADDLAREETQLLEQFGDQAEAGDLLATIRERRGLGEVRYRRLLWRNAALRRLVASEETPISEAMLRSTYELNHGDLYELRLITTPTLREATAVRRRLAAGEPFAEVAAEVSTDISRHRGGLLAPLSLADATYPQVLCDAARGLAVAQVSVPLALESGYAIVRLERIEARERPEVEAVRDKLEAQIRIRQQRLRMDELARSLLEEAQVTVFERGIEWAP
ncbi:MAG: peptidyl-prolyl cis-trans isomerase [Phycisphaerales bacterium JB038]